MTTNVRQPAVAGAFYPAEPDKLHAMVQGFLDRAEATGPLPKAIIAPHAGYIYSGSIAASAYVRLQQGRDTIRRVVLLGPSHRVSVRGLAASSAEWFVTPLGKVPIDRQAVEEMIDLPFVQVMDQAHSMEHSLEVHLPFLQEVLGPFELIPVVVGDAKPEQVADVLERLWGGDETVIVISSDLSHYHDYQTARRMDSATSQAIESLQWEAIDYDSACGRVPVNGLLYAARKHALKGSTVDLRNSGDTAGPRDRVVGYGAYVFE